MPSPADRDENIFSGAVDLSVGERTHFLDAACGGDAELRQRVVALLQASDAAEGFMEVPPLALPQAASGLADSLLSPPDLAENQIGRYRLLQKIGEGGCGVVYMAEQEEPVRRRVALKVIKLGMDTKAVIARFEAERQALAMMDHPNIARVLDAGATENGRPYFVMELVRGIKITEYCDHHRLSTVQRLELFGQVCVAVQHAHLKGVIHRDLKPSNILVSVDDGVAVPKVIDFGIAKATQGRLTDHTLFTAFEQFIGTPAYMSPEQAEMSSLDVDTRSDIYSLGVLLYELLTGRTPFDAQTLRQAGIDEIRRLIRDVEPPKPSTRLGTLSDSDSMTVAKLRATDVPKLSILLSGDIDWIVMKALDKNRARRYETASALAADISRHLQNEPVNARPPRASYLIQKLISRNRLAFAAAAAVMLALVLGLGVAVWSLAQQKTALARAVAAEKEQSRARAQAEEARTKEAQQRALAEAEEVKAKLSADKSRQAYRFISGMLAGVGPSRAAGRDTVLLREILDKTVKRLGTEMKDQPEVELNLLATLGAVYLDLGDLAKAEAMAHDALAKAEKLYGREHEDVAAALTLLGEVYLLQGHGPESEPLVREALAIARKFPGSQNENLMSALSVVGTCLMGQGKLPAAEAHYREALALVTSHSDTESLPLENLQMMLAFVLQKEGRLAEAEPLFKQALSAQKEHLGDAHPTVGYTQVGLSNVLMSQGKLPEAESLFHEALAILKKSLGDEHPTIAMVRFNLAFILHQSGRLQEAEIQYREVLALQQKVLGPDHPATRQTGAMLGQVLQQEHKLAEAETVRQVAAAAPASPSGDEALAAALRKTDRAMADMGQQKFADAEIILREALPVIESALGSSHQAVLGTRIVLIQALFMQGKSSEAEGIARDLLKMCRRDFGNSSTIVVQVLSLLANTLQAQGKLPETENVLREALGMARAQSADGKNPGVASTLVSLATIKAVQEDLSERDRLLEEAVAMLLAVPENIKTALYKSVEMMAVKLKDTGHSADAVKLEQVAVILVRRFWGSESDAAVWALGTLSWLQNLAGQSSEGEASAREGLAICRKLMPAGHWRIAAAEYAVGECLVGQKKYTEAEPVLLSVFDNLKKNGPEKSDALFSFWREKLRYTATFLAEIYTANNELPKAAEWKAKAAEYTGADPAPPLPGKRDAESKPQ